MPALLDTALSESPGRAERSVANRPTPAAHEPRTLKRIPEAVPVYIETARGSGEFELVEYVDWSNIYQGIDGTDTTATLAVRALDASKLGAGGSIGTQHFKHILEKLHPDLRVRIAMGRGADPPVHLFQGFPTSRTPSWSERHQAVSCTCIGEAQELLRRSEACQILGRKMRFNPLADWDATEPDLVTVEALPPIFNAGGKPNRAREELNIDTGEGASSAHGVFAFAEDGAEEALYWNFADALRYVATHYIQSTGLPVSALEFLRDTEEFVGLNPAVDAQDPFTRMMTARVPAVSIQSMNAEEALVALCDAAGLHFELPIRAGTSLTAAAEYYLRIYATLENETHEDETHERRMVAPKVLDIPRDAPFTDYTGLTPTDIANRNAAQQADVTLDARAINAPIILGGFKEFQVNLLLRPGWKPDPNIDNLATTAAKDAAILFWEEAFGLDDGVDEFDPETEQWKTKYHPKHPEFHTVADVLRRWVFPDDWSYLNADFTTSPYSRDVGPWTSPGFYSPYADWLGIDKLIYTNAQLGGSVPPDEVAEWTPRRRPFLELIGRLHPATTSRTPAVWLNFSATDPFSALADPRWVRHTGEVTFDEQRAAIWFPDDNLHASPHLRQHSFDQQTSMIEAYIGLNDDGITYGLPHFFVAISCTVRGDRRMTQRPRSAGASVTRGRTQTIDLGTERFVLRRRMPAPPDLGTGEHPFAALTRSFLSLPRDGDPQFNDRDDSEAFRKHCEQLSKRMALDSISGSPEVPWIKTDVRIGDSFSGISGLGIAFNGYPEVVGIEYVKDPQAGFRTKYHLKDLRNAPEIGSES